MPAEASPSSPPHLESALHDSRRAPIGCTLFGILVLAAALRLYHLTQVPPGLNQDEAANAWNAWCVLKTGQDQVGQHWPIFYIRALGENRSALFIYWMMPFELIGGISVWMNRIPAVVGGLLSIALAFWVARRLFGPWIALAAAALLAVNPAHIQMSRFGHEASLVPLLCLLPLAALMWAGFPLDDRSSGTPRPIRAILAGLLTGICCYGYPAVRLFVPVFLVACVLVSAGAWWALFKTRRGRASLGGLALAVGVTFGPLLYMHIAHPDIIAKRGEGRWAWWPEHPFSVKLARVGDRYIRHFEPEFLYELGDADEKVWDAGFGFLPGYLFPLQLAGLGVLVCRCRRSRAARLLLAAVVLYPTGDLLNWHISLHGMRSLPGLVPLVLLGAVGLAEPVAYLLRRRLPATLIALLVAIGGPAAVQTGRFLHSYFVERQKQLAVYLDFAEHALEAIRWLRPQLDSADAVVTTAVGMNHTHLPILVELGYDPHRWFAEPRDVQWGTWDRYTRFGKFYFLYEEERLKLLDGLRSTGRPFKAFFLLRPEEPPLGRRIHEIIGPDGMVQLVVYELQG